MRIIVLEPTHVRLSQSEAHLRDLVAVIQALVPMGADCGLPSLLAEVESFLEDSVPVQQFH